MSQLKNELKMHKDFAKPLLDKFKTGPSVDELGELKEFKNKLVKLEKDLGECNSSIDQLREEIKVETEDEESMPPFGLPNFMKKTSPKEIID